MTTNWVHMYELAKISLNNRGNDLKSTERRSVDNVSDLSSRSLNVDQENQPDGGENAQKLAENCFSIPLGIEILKHFNC